MDFIRVGKIANTHGVKGCLKIIPLTDDIDRFDELEYVYVENENKKRKITNVWYRKGMVYLDLEGVESMDDAMKLKEKYLQIDESQLKELPEGSYYIFDLIGLEVYSTAGDYIGKIKEVHQTGANDVYEVLNGYKTYYIPAIKDVVKEISIENKNVTIDVLEGLLD